MPSTMRILISILLITIVVLIYLLKTTNSSTSTVQNLALNTANKTIASQNILISGLQSNLSLLNDKANKIGNLLASANLTIADLENNLNAVKSSLGNTTNSSPFVSAENTIANQKLMISGMQSNLSFLQDKANTLINLLASANATISSLEDNLNIARSALANVTCTPSITSTNVPLTLNTAISPLVVSDSNANLSAALISVGNGTESGSHGNSVSKQIEEANGVSPQPNGYLLSSYENNKILIAGYSAQETINASNKFIKDIIALSQNSTGGITFENVPIINSAGQPVIQIVIGSASLPSDGIAASNIAATIGSLSHTTTAVTCFLSH